MKHLAPRPGEWILEVGVGTGLSARDYPQGCRVVAIDISEAMLSRAQSRFRRTGIEHVSLCRMDTVRLAFAGPKFDAVYAPYVMNIVPDPVGAVREVLRVCRPDARLVFLNHFADTDAAEPITTRVAGSLAAKASGVNWQLNLEEFLRATGLTAVSRERVNLRISTVVTCRQS
jgi:phosphatidylethanolamine/phosphatidyl-N-methylethanolamine N-methyltransferase